jgi:acyl-CoA synthetase (AMP-forming)/AMP-acid ligase II
MLTSGTTGAPKRIPLKRDAFEKSFAGALVYEKDRNEGDAAKLRPGTTILSNPMTHIGGLWGALTCIAGGRKACLLEKFSVESWRDAIVRHQPKVAGAVPAGLRMILDANIPKEDLSSLVALRTGAARSLGYGRVHGALQSARSPELRRDRIFRCGRGMGPQGLPHLLEG